MNKFCEMSGSNMPPDKNRSIRLTEWSRYTNLFQLSVTV